MAFDIEGIHKSSRRVLRFLKKNSRRPGSSAIHNFRTSARSLETAFTTLEMTDKRKVRLLLRRLGEVRRSAGNVRDMDVLTANALSMDPSGELDCLVQLLEHLGAKRSKYARKLRGVVAKTKPRLGRGLKRSSLRLEQLLRRAETKPAEADALPVTLAKAIKLSSSLSRPAKLTKSNLHLYRLKVRELRNILQLADRPEDREFLKELSDVKDAIGDWHDWEELSAIAGDLLDHGDSCRLLKDLGMISKSKYEHALSLTNHLRSNNLKSRGKKRVPVSTPVLDATSGMAVH